MVRPCQTFAMQRRRPSGELDVFGATRYFDGDLVDLPTAGPVAASELQGLKTQVKTAHDAKTEETHQYGRSQLQGLGARSKSSLAAFFGSLLVSPEASFREKREAAAAATSSSLTPSHVDEPPKASSSSSSRGSIDLGAVMGDRRLQGVRVVRSAGGDEERWVVRCGPWEEELHHEKMFDAASGVDRDQVEGKGDGDERCWDSDTSSDLFELDLERDVRC